MQSYTYAIDHQGILNANTNMKTRLEDLVESAPPCGPGSHLLALFVDVVPVKLTAPSVNINVFGSEPGLTLPEVTAKPEEQDDGEGEIRLEEAFGSSDALADRRDCSVELIKR